MVEQAAHVLDLARALVGEVTEVYAAGNGTPPPVEGADVDARHRGHRCASPPARSARSARACVLGWKQRAGLEIIADGLALSLGEDGLVVRDADGDHGVVAGDPEAARVAVDRAFVDAVRGDRRRRAGAVRRGAAHPPPGLRGRRVGRPAASVARSAPAGGRTWLTAMRDRGAGTRPVRVGSWPSRSRPLRDGAFRVETRATAASRPAPS